MAERLELSRPTVHGLLRTLHAHGLVDQDPDSDKYQLGAGLLYLGNAFLDLNEVRSRSMVHAERLALRADAAVRVGVRYQSVVLVVHHVFRPDASLQILEVGAQLPVQASALGKAMLGFSSAEERDRHTQGTYPRLTSNTLDADALRAELEVVREVGVAAEKDEAVLGESSIAAAIFDHQGSVIGAIGVVCETERLVSEDLERTFVTEVGDAARGCSRDFGLRSWPAAVE